MSINFLQVSWNGKEDACYEESVEKTASERTEGRNWKYLVVLILMIATIGFVSGFLVADGKMIKAYNEGFEKYKIEDRKFPGKEKKLPKHNRKTSRKMV